MSLRGEHVQHAQTTSEAGQDATVVLDADSNSSARSAPATIQQTLGSTDQTPQSLVDIHQSLVDLMQIVQDNTRYTQAALHNTARVVFRNSRVQRPYPYSPLQKTVAGSGHVLANAIRDIDGEIAALEPAPEIGAFPPDFNGQLAEYSEAEILRLVVFYNEDFGIVQSDPLPVRIDKFWKYIAW